MSHRPILNLEHRHFTHKRGDITVIGSWYYDADEGARLPCLVLVPTNIWGSKKITPCIIPTKNAWLWSEEEGDPAYCAASVVAFGMALGISVHNEVSCMRVLSLVRDYMGDLLTMPPAPAEGATHTADAIWKDEHGKEHHREVFDHV